MSVQGRFTTGSTMRHVVVMTTTGMIGLTFMFLVDAITLFWVSKLDSHIYMAAMGYAWTIQFFTISAGVAFMIAATATVSRALGQGDREKAKRAATVSAVWTVIILCFVCLILVTFRETALSAVGAKGETLAVASKFLLISVPSLPIMSLAMIGAAILRAEGDAWRSMMCTTSAGIVAVFADPFLIFTMGLGVDGAALGIVVSRTVSAALSLYFILHVKKLAAPINRADMRAYAPAFFAVAAPTIVTQLASPTGNYLATGVISDFGEQAVAGWAVMGRLTVLAFGGVFALSGAIGGIVGQNYGARKFDRVRSAYVDSLIFSTVYVLITWGLLVLLTPTIIGLFELSPQAAEVIYAFNYYAAGTFVFAGFLYVSNASFNNLGRPQYSTVFNWLKDGLLMLPLCMLGAAYFGAAGVIYGQGAAVAIAGLMSVIVGWRFIKTTQAREVAAERG